jgi:hypothetical protein
LYINILAKYEFDSFKHDRSFKGADGVFKKGLSQTSQLLATMLKSLIGLVLLTITRVNFAKNVDPSKFVFANKGAECARGWASRCCGCPSKGAVYRVGVLNDIFWNLFLTENPSMTNLVDLSNFTAFVQGGRQVGADFCCAGIHDFASFVIWFDSFQNTRTYPVYKQGEPAYKKEKDGCVVGQFELITVGPLASKDALAPCGPSIATRAFKVISTWCPSEECNWLLTGVNMRSYGCFNTTIFLCPV